MTAVAAAAPATITIDQAYVDRDKDDQLNAGGAPKKTAGKAGKSPTSKTDDSDAIDPETGLPVSAGKPAGAMFAKASLAPEEGDGFTARARSGRSYRAGPVAA